MRIEGGKRRDGDRHAILVDRDACRLYELYALRRGADGGWSAGSGAAWDLRSNRLRPAGWTSADAAGLPILPGLARYDEVASRSDPACPPDHCLAHAQRVRLAGATRGERPHATRRCPPMGTRLRLRRTFDVSRFPRQARIVLRALQEYGVIVADNGSDWFVSGVPDPRWSNDELHTLHRVPGSAFEVVDPAAIRPR